MDVVAWGGGGDSLHICHSLRKLSSRTCLTSYTALICYLSIRSELEFGFGELGPKTAILVTTRWCDFQAIATWRLQIARVLLSASADSHTATVGSTIWRAPEEPSSSPGSLPPINAAISKPALGFNGPDVCFTICVDLHQVNTEVTSILTNI